MLAPIVLFVYNRPFHTQQTLLALSQNDLAMQSTLIIYADGAKNKDSEAKVAEVRQLIRQRQWCKEVIIRESEVNKGLTKAILEGVTEVINEYGKAIVLEDDLVTSKGFLKYMNEALDFYENTPQVMHISGYMFPIRQKLPNDTVFYQSTSCWSWATWKDRWQHLCTDAQWLYDELIRTNKMYRFDLDGSNQFKSQLEMNISGRRSTWSIKWEASVHLAGGLCLHPTQTMVRNIGHDGSGSSFDFSGQLHTQALRAYTQIKPIPLEESTVLRERMKLYYALDGDLRPKKVMWFYVKKYTIHLFLPTPLIKAIKELLRKKQ
jgi:hypothetical protein